MNKKCPYCEKSIPDDKDAARYDAEFGVGVESPKDAWPDEYCWSMYYEGWCMNSDKDAYERMIELWEEVQALRERVKEQDGQVSVSHE
jgi:hypothetical protein